MIRWAGFIPPVKIVCTFVNRQISLIIIYLNIGSGVLFLK